MAPLRLNLDETSIVLNHDEDKGVISKSSKDKVVLVKKKSRQRGSLTHVAIVCDDSQVQPLLPQFIIGNEHVLRVQDLKELEPALPKNVILIRAKSSWITVELFIVLLEMLRQTLNLHNVTRHPILLLDCCPVHLHARVLRVARKNAIYLCYVPASLTWLLQPLDVKILRRLKACLRGLYRRSQIANHAACVPTVEIVRNLAKAIRQILQGNSWVSAFDACGYSNIGTELTSTIKKLITDNNSCVWDAAAVRLSDSDVVHILPQKRKYDLGALLWDHMISVPKKGLPGMMPNANDGPPAKRTGLPASSSLGFPSRCSSMAATTSDETPIAYRTRSHSRLLGNTDSIEQLGPDTAASSAACPSSMLPPVPPSLHPTPEARPLQARAMAAPRRPQAL